MFEDSLYVGLGYLDCEMIFNCIEDILSGNYRDVMLL